MRLILTVKSAHSYLTFFKGIDLGKIGQICDLIFLQKTSLYMLVGQVSKYFGASATVNPPKMSPKGGNTCTFMTFIGCLLLLL